MAVFLVNANGAACINVNGGGKSRECCNTCVCPGTQTTISPCCCIPIGQPGSCATETAFGQQCHCAMPCACPNNEAKAECCCIPSGQPGSCAGTAPCFCAGAPSCCLTHQYYYDAVVPWVVTGQFHNEFWECCTGGTQLTKQCDLAINGAGSCSVFQSPAARCNLSCGGNGNGLVSVQATHCGGPPNGDTCSVSGTFGWSDDTPAARFIRGFGDGGTWQVPGTGNPLAGFFGSGSVEQTASCSGGTGRRGLTSGTVNVSFMGVHPCGPSGITLIRKSSGIVVPDRGLVIPSAPCEGCSQAAAQIITPADARAFRL